MNFNKQNLKKGFLIFSWGLYDLANQFFALNIVSFYFVRWLTIEKGVPEIFYGIAFGISTFFIAISGPILGAISDMLNRRRSFLIYLTLLSIFFTMILGVSENIFVALLFFAIANYGCQTATVFYNALMINITPKDKIGLVSGIGKMLSYSGAILALYFMKPVVLRNGYKATFLPTGILFFIFALPCMLFIKDKAPPDKNINLFGFLNKNRIAEIFKDLKNAICGSHTVAGLSDFLKASFFGFCAVNVVILFMSVYATKVFKLNDVQVADLIIFSTLFAILGSFICGYMSDRIGARITLIFVSALWMICLVLGSFVSSIKLYWLVGSLVGMALGGVWVVTRALAMQLVPAERIGEVFGLFNFVGYLAGIVGSLFWGLILLFLSRQGEIGYRIALFSLNLFLLLGFIFLLRIPRITHKTS